MITSDDIIMLGKVVSAILIIIGVPSGIYKAFKKWSDKLFNEINSLKNDMNNIKTDMNSLQVDNNRRFNEVNDNIRDLRSSTGTFYKVLSTVVEVMYRNDPSNEKIENVKDDINNELINNATR
jgi:hypothetical protein